MPVVKGTEGKANLMAGPVLRQAAPRNAGQ